MGSVGESTLRPYVHYVKLRQLMDHGVRQIIRERIEADRLPRDHTIELWHGPGLGQTCDGRGLTNHASRPDEPDVCG